MKRIFQFFVTKWLSKTPIGLAVLGAGWWFSRRKKSEQEQAGKKQVRRLGRRPVRR